MKTGGLDPTMVLQLLLPEGVYEVAFEIVGRMFEQGSIAALLAHLGVAFAQSIQTFLFSRLDDQGVDIYRPRNLSAVIRRVPARISFTSWCLDLGRPW